MDDEFVLLNCFRMPQRQNINLQKECDTVSLSEAETMNLFGDEELSCLMPAAVGMGKHPRRNSFESCPSIGYFLPRLEERRCPRLERRARLGK